MPKVHHLVEQFVDDDKVVTDRLLLNLLEVLGEHSHQLVQVEDDLSCVGIALRQREDWCERPSWPGLARITPPGLGAQTRLTVEVVVPDVHVVDALVRKAGSQRNIVLLHIEDQRQELVHTRRWHIIAVVPLDEGLGLASVEGRLGRGAPCPSCPGWRLRLACRGARELTQARHVV